MVFGFLKYFDNFQQAMYIETGDLFKLKARKMSRLKLLIKPEVIFQLRLQVIPCLCIVLIALFDLTDNFLSFIFKTDCDIREYRLI